MRHCAVTICDVWSPPWDAGVDGLTADLFRSRESRILGKAVALAHRWQHGVPVHPLLIRGFPVTGLRHAGSQADLLVVGSRGAGGVRGLVLGSVSQYLVHHAPCTTIIAHHRGTP